MDFFWVLVIGGGFAFLWMRQDKLEQRFARLEEAQDASFGLDLGERLTRLERAQREAETTPQPEAEPTREPEAAPSPRTADIPPVAEKIVQPSVPVTSRKISTPVETAPEFAAPPAPSFTERFSFKPSFDFEHIFGRILPIWGGGIALAIAGFFMVRWSIENSLLNEQVRVALGFAFGTGLLVAAEVAYRFEQRVADPRVRQALAGAGLATLYASCYLAGAQYGLIGPATTFAGMALVTALAVALSYRFGLPCAVLGLVGGFAAPILAGGTEPNLPLLATYLALVTGGLAYTGTRQDRPWLSIAALAGGLGWGALMLLTGPADNAGILALGGYLVLVGTLLPSLMGQGVFGKIGRIVAAALATFQIAALVGNTGYGLLAWGCYLLIALALAVLGWRNARLREASGIAAALAAFLLAAWPQPELGWYGAIAAACAALFAGVPLAHIWREKPALIDWAMLAGFPLLLMGALCVQFQLAPVPSQNFAVALVAAALAVLTALGTWLRWPAMGERFAAGPLGAMAATIVLAWLGAMLAVPAWATPLANAALAAAVWSLLRERTSPEGRAAQWALAVMGVLLLAATASWDGLELLVNPNGVRPEWLFALRWLAAAVPFALLLMQDNAKWPTRLAELALTLLAYGAAAMVVPGAIIPTTLALAAIALAWRMPERSTALATLLTLGGLWAAWTFGEWAIPNLEALAGEPAMLADLPSMRDLLVNVVPLALAFGAGIMLRAKLFARFAKSGWVVAGALAVVVAHTAYKQLFAITDLEAFVALGMAERTVWQGLLGALGFALTRLPERMAGQAAAGRIIGAVALVHFALFSLILHNPLLDAQAVGAWPLINWLAPAYALAVALIVWLRASERRHLITLRPLFDGAVMVLIALLALSELRHAFAGSILIAPDVSAREDLLRSLLAIVVALGFLGWGALRQQRSWRIGSLVLMLLAVGKVFIFDAAGLEGLARIGSFFALGICLIGIGWFYSRQLKGAGPAGQAEQSVA